MHFVIIVLLETLAASVAARPIVVSPDLSYASAPSFRNGMHSNTIEIKGGEEDQPDLQPRDEAVVDVLGLNNEDAGMSNQQNDKEIAHVSPNNDLPIAPRANKKPTKAELKADDKKFHRDQLRPDDAKYINNLDKANAKKCGTNCQHSLDSERSQRSREAKEKQRNAPNLPGSRASRGEVNSKEDDYQHDLNHLRMDRGDIGQNGKNSLNSWHSVESANSKASKASKASKGGKTHG
ncbi:hypothetical protein CaCOL14_006573 [Colletotrichum acutatum]|uniref:Uncharacterized protein n=1 Tax=Glomerella acutata TaxID=27357 RepID=A0AAD8UTT3_GLOAC|nr:uncharacterized protein BDZ83DRAFT_614645 [Colletotrichum acutatum]KAK1726999.1 hypothetical protein BDZ83DRAFT_614645 [Colletotrichum acutatum]